MAKCIKCGIYGINGNICNMCRKYGDKIFIISDDLNRKHIKKDKNCKACDEWYSIDKDNISFPIKHKHCKGLIHLDRIGYCDAINLIFKCDKCNKELNTWTEGERIDLEFKEIFGDLL